MVTGGDLSGSSGGGVGGGSGRRQSKSLTCWWWYPARLSAPGGRLTYKIKRNRACGCSLSEVLQSPPWTASDPPRYGVATTAWSLSWKFILETG